MKYFLFLKSNRGKYLPKTSLLSDLKVNTKIIHIISGRAFRKSFAPYF